MEENEALMTATFFSSRYGSSPVIVLSARLLWQYVRIASTVPTCTLHIKKQLPIGWHRLILARNQLHRNSVPSKPVSYRGQSDLSRM